MLSAAAVTTRLQSLTPELLRKVEGAADFMMLRRAGKLPLVTPCAHVMPGDLRGGARQDAAGAYVQDYEETVAVMLTFRANDPQGSRAMEQLDDIIAGVVASLCGWAPMQGPGAFRLIRGSVASMDAEALIYLLEFAIPMQLRSA